MWVGGCGTWYITRGTRGVRGVRGSGRTVVVVVLVVVLTVLHVVQYTCGTPNVMKKIMRQKTTSTKKLDL